MSHWFWLVLVGVFGVAIGYVLPHASDDEALAEALGLEKLPEREAEDWKWLAVLLDVLDAGILFIDHQDLVVRTNPAAGRMFGTDAARMVGRAIIEATSSVELERRVEAARGGVPSRDRMHFSTSRGSATLRLIVQAIGENSVLVVAIDETALLESERLRHEFVGNISHELRTPLAGLRLMFETLQDDDAAATRAYFYPQIADEIQRLVELVEHLLEVARSEAGRIEVRKEPVELHELVQRRVAGFEARLQERRIMLERDIVPVTLLADKGSLSQIFVNLVENALRHTAVGGRITVRTGRRDGEAFLEVADNGSGIPFKDLPHIFERFYVVERSRAKGQSGLGLGLALVKGHVEALGGRILVTSELGTGSCFTVLLPTTADADE